MLRNVLRIVVLAVVVFFCALASMHMKWVENNFPLNSERTISLDFGMVSVPKAELVAQLDDIAEAHDAVLIKDSSDPHDPANSIILYYFGSNLPRGYTAGTIDWFDPQIQAVLKPSAEITDATLTGSYNISGPVGTDREIEQWITGLGGGYQSATVYVPWRSMLFLLAKTGAGIAFVALTVLSVALLVAWFAALVRSRSLRILSGLPPRRIHGEDVGTVFRLVLWWSAIGSLAAMVFALLRYGSDHVVGFVSELLLLLAIFIGGVLAGATALSFAFWPTVDSIAHRTSTTPALKWFAWGLKAVSLLLVLVTIPTLLTSIGQLRSAQSDATRWQPLSEVVSLNSNASDQASLAYEHGVSAMLTQAQAQGHLALAYPAGDYLVSSPAGIAPYDEVVITNPQYLRWWGLDQQSNALSKVEFGNLSQPLREGIETYLEIWRKDQSKSMSGISLFSYEASQVFPAPRSDGTGSLIQAKHVLLIVVDEPASVLDTSRFLYPALSTGNIMFSNRENASSLIAENNLDDAINSIDRVADTQLSVARDFTQEIQMRISSALLLICALALTLMASLRTWIAQHIRHIFCFHTSGYSHLRTARSVLAMEAATFFVAAVLAMFVLPLTSPTPLITGIAVSAIGFVIYMGIAALGYRRASATAFNHTTQRKV